MSMSLGEPILGMFSLRQNPHQEGGSGKPDRGTLRGEVFRPLDLSPSKKGPSGPFQRGDFRNSLD